MSSKKARNRREHKPPEPAELARRDDWTDRQFWTVIAVGLLFCACTAVELGGTRPDGSLAFTHWLPWRDLGIFHTAALLGLPFLLIVWVLWETEKGLSPKTTASFVGLLALASLSLEALATVANPKGLALVERIASNPVATSYYNDAIRIGDLSRWMPNFYHLQLHYHSSTHPPGPVLFYFLFCKMFSRASAAFYGGWAIGILASLGVVVMYRFAALWTEDRKARLTAAAFYALIPSVTLFFPEFDQLYPMVCMLLVLSWVRALASHSLIPKAAVFAGVMLFCATFMAYNLLTLGAFLLLYWFWRFRVERASGLDWGKLLRPAVIVVGVWAGIYTVLWLTTGFRPIASLQSAMVNQARIEERWRAYLPFLGLDLYDYFLGAGMIALPILILHLRRVIPELDSKRTDIALTLIGMITVLTIDLSGQLRGETARVWLFLQPLLAVPVALEIGRQRWSWRLSIFALQWWILVCLDAKMTFLDA